MKTKQYIYICGNAKSPVNASVGMNQFFALELIVNIETYEIKDASCTLITDLGRNFIRSLLVGRSIKDDYDTILNDIQMYYLALPQKALMSAFKVCCNRLKQYVGEPQS